MKRYIVFITCIAVSLIILQFLTGWLLTIAYQPELYGQSGGTTVVGNTYLMYVNVLIASTIAFLFSNRVVPGKR